MPCAPRCCRGFANSLRSNSANPFLGSLSGARLRDNGDNRRAAYAVPAHGVVALWLEFAGNQLFDCFPALIQHRILGDSSDVGLFFA